MTIRISTQLIQRADGKYSTQALLNGEFVGAADAWFDTPKEALEDGRRRMDDIRADLAKAGHRTQRIGLS